MGGRQTTVGIYTRCIDPSRRIPSFVFSVSGVLPIKFYLSECILSSSLEIDVAHLCDGVLILIWMVLLVSCPDVKKCLVVLLLVMTGT